MGVMSSCSSRRPEGWRTTLTDGLDSQSETSGACWQRHQCRTPARLGAERSSPSSQGGDAKPRDVMLG
jgi:hypothetical protein